MAFFSYKGMWRNKEWETFLLFSVICSNVVSDHNEFFIGLVLIAHLEREVFSTLEAGIPPAGLPGPTHNLLELIQI